MLSYRTIHSGTSYDLLYILLKTECNKMWKFTEAEVPWETLRYGASSEICTINHIIWIYGGFQKLLLCVIWMCHTIPKDFLLSQILHSESHFLTIINQKLWSPSFVCFWVTFFVLVFSAIENRFTNAYQTKKEEASRAPDIEWGPSDKMTNERRVQSTSYLPFERAKCGLWFIIKQPQCYPG